MDNKVLLAVFAFLVALCVGGTSAKSFSKDVENEVEADVDPNERATWLDTRDTPMKDEFKVLAYEAIISLVKDGLLNSAIVEEPSSSSVDKRGRWQGFCFRRTRSGRFLPYICWKGARK